MNTAICTAYGKLKDEDMFQISGEKTWVKFVVLLLSLCCLIINLYAVIKYGDYFLLGSMEKMNNDDVRYIRTAQVLLEKGMLVDLDVNSPTLAEMPGHAMMLAAAFKLFGYPGGITAFRILQAILQALCIYLVFLTARSLFDVKTALLACLFSVFYLPDVVSSGLILMEVSCKFLLLLLVYITIIAIRTKKVSYYIAGGVIWGLSCLIRPTLSLYPAVVLVVWLKNKYSFREMLKLTLVTSAVFTILLAPWWVRNYISFGRFVPFSLASGNPFLQGTYINYDQSRDFMGYYPGRDAAETDRIEMETGIKRLKTFFWKEPAKYIHWYTIGKTKHLWYFPYYWRTVYDIPFNTVTRYHLFLMYTGIFGAIALLWNGSRKESLLLILIPVYFTLLHLPFFTFSRYSYPVIPLVIILSAYGLRTTAGYIHNGSIRSQTLTDVKI